LDQPPAPDFQLYPLSDESDDGIDLPPPPPSPLDQPPAGAIISPGRPVLAEAPRRSSRPRKSGKKCLLCRTPKPRGGRGCGERDAL
jgi:hypothetical protein